MSDLVYLLLVFYERTSIHISIYFCLFVCLCDVARVRRTVISRVARFDCKEVPSEPDPSVHAVYTEAQTANNKAEVEAQLQFIRQVHTYSQCRQNQNDSIVNQLFEWLLQVNYIVPVYCTPTVCRSSRSVRYGSSSSSSQWRTRLPSRVRRGRARRSRRPRGRSRVCGCSWRSARTAGWTGRGQAHTRGSASTRAPANTRASPSRCSCSPPTTASSTCSCGTGAPCVAASQAEAAIERGGERGSSLALEAQLIWSAGRGRRTRTRTRNRSGVHMRPASALTRAARRTASRRTACRSRRASATTSPTSTSRRYRSSSTATTDRSRVFSLSYSVTSASILFILEAYSHFFTFIIILLECRNPSATR